jgi:predicted PurR-regulated permease PerM
VNFIERRALKHKIIVLTIFIFLVYCINIPMFIIHNNQIDNIDKKLNIIIDNSNKTKIDSLQEEIMDIGWKYDSLLLKYEYNWEFK